MKKNYFFDLDGTLVDCKRFIWVIDKNKPSYPLMKMTPLDFSLIKYNFYKEDGLLVEFDGQSFFISQELFDNIQKIKKLPIERLGFSFREFKDKKYINSEDFDFLYQNIKHLVGSKTNITFLTARSNRYKHGDFLNKLRFILENLNLKLYKIYFIGKKHEVYHRSYLSFRKALILLEHMIGLKIKNEKFIDKKQDKFDKLYFYDDNDSINEYVNNLQEIFEGVYKNTSSELKQIIMKSLEEEPILYNNLVYPNLINNFKTQEIKLKSPIKFPIVENRNVLNFNDFLTSYK